MRKGEKEKLLEIEKRKKNRQEQKQTEREWTEEKYSYITSVVVRIVSFISSHKIHKVLHSKYFGFIIFKAKLYLLNLQK